MGQGPREKIKDEGVGPRGKVEVTLPIPPSDLPGELALIIPITLGGSGLYH